MTLRRFWWKLLKLRIALTLQGFWWKLLKLLMTHLTSLCLIAGLHPQMYRLHPLLKLHPLPHLHPSSLLPQLVVRLHRIHLHHRVSHLCTVTSNSFTTSPFSGHFQGLSTHPSTLNWHCLIMNSSYTCTKNYNIIHQPHVN